MGEGVAGGEGEWGQNWRKGKGKGGGGGLRGSREDGCDRRRIKIPVAGRLATVADRSGWQFLLCITGRIFLSICLLFLIFLVIFCCS